VEGRVIDADDERSISGATVTTVQLCHPGRCGSVDQSASTSTDENGMFVIAVNLPEDWESLLLDVTSERGYERVRTYVNRATVAEAVLRMYRTVTLHSGESVQLRVLYLQGCTFEDWPCRRIVLEASSNESTDLEVTARDSQDKVGLVVGEPPLLVEDPPRHVTMRGRGDIWILRGISASEGWVTVAARRQ
jgi:hypothetical protein